MSTRDLMSELRGTELLRPLTVLGALLLLLATPLLFGVPLGAQDEASETADDAVAAAEVAAEATADE